LTTPCFFNYDNNILDKEGLTECVVKNNPIFYRNRIVDDRMIDKRMVDILQMREIVNILKKNNF
jgi:hypothetical protein